MVLVGVVAILGVGYVVGEIVLEAMKALCSACCSWLRGISDSESRMRTGVQPLRGHYVREHCFPASMLGNLQQNTGKGAQGPAAQFN